MDDNKNTWNSVTIQVNFDTWKSVYYDIREEIESNSVTTIWSSFEVVNSSPSSLFHSLLT
jgi:hypothetical protein